MLETLETLYWLLGDLLTFVHGGLHGGAPEGELLHGGLGDGVRRGRPSRPYASICARWCSSEAAGRHCTGAKLMVEARPDPARHQRL